MSTNARFYISYASKQTFFCSENRNFHQANMSVYCRPPYIPLLYSKTGVYRGIHNFLIFALKQRLWVLVRTTSMYPQSQQMMPYFNRGSINVVFIFFSDHRLKEPTCRVDYPTIVMIRPVQVKSLKSEKSR